MKKNRKGFTLAELLIVVAIIAVLVAVAIPVFASQLEKSKESTDLANVRAAYATLVADYMENNNENSIVVPPAGQNDATWTYYSGVLNTMVNGKASSVSIPGKTKGSNYTVSINASGQISVT